MTATAAHAPYRFLGPAVFLAPRRREGIPPPVHVTGVRNDFVKIGGIGGIPRLAIGTTP